MCGDAKGANEEHIFIAETSDYLNTRVVSTGQTDQEHEAKIVNGSSLRIGNSASANLIPLGSVTFTADFTLNRLHDLITPASQPFG